MKDFGTFFSFAFKDNVTAIDWHNVFGFISIQQQFNMKF